MLKNYTSLVPAARSVQYIEDKLVAHGAKSIMKDYEDGRLVGICFLIMVNNIETPFKLPSRTEECERILKGKVKRANDSTYKRIKEQAERTAWKLLSDWVDIQMSLIELGQMELVEIFLPFLYDVAQKKTHFEILKERNFKGLLEAPKP